MNYQTIFKCFRDKPHLRDGAVPLFTRRKLDAQLRSQKLRKMTEKSWKQMKLLYPSYKRAVFIFEIVNHISALGS